MSLLVSRLGCRVGGKNLLADVSLRVEAGSLVVVLGPNGSGKTSLLRAASGELVPHSGCVEFCGVDLQTLSLERRAERIGVLPQNSALDFPFQVQEVVQMGRIPHLTEMRIHQRVVEEVLDEMQLQDIRHRIYPTLSGGEKQRVQIARVLCQIWDVMEHACLLLDEPTSALDLSHQLSLLKTLEYCARRGVTALIVLHDVNLALRFAEQVVLLSEGRVLDSGNPARVLSVENMRQAFQVEVSIHPGDTPERPYILVREPVRKTVPGTA